MVKGVRRIRRHFCCFDWSAFFASVWISTIDTYCCRFNPNITTPNWLSRVSVPSLYSCLSNSRTRLIRNGGGRLEDMTRVRGAVSTLSTKVFLPPHRPLTTLLTFIQIYCCRRFQTTQPRLLPPFEPISHPYRHQPQSRMRSKI